MLHMKCTFRNNLDPGAYAALVARQAIVSELERNTMPPATESSSTGIADASEREQLLSLARRFAAAGDHALEAEGEPLH
jgi:hypothetical protein